jgi:hypothetical protein
MQQAETIYILYADVAEWSYEDVHHAPDNAAVDTRPHLVLYGATTTFPDIVEPFPLRLCLVCGDDQDDKEARFGPWLLDLLPAMSDPDLPSSLEAWLPLPQEKFDNLKECLIRFVGMADCSVRVTLQVQEKIGARFTEVAERCFAIVDFGYSLSYERSNK